MSNDGKDADAIIELERELAMMIRLLEAVQRRRNYPLERAQYLLIQLLERDGPLSVGDAARRLLLDESTATRQIAGLEQLGLVRKQVNPEDSRSAIVTVTAEGSRRAEAMRLERLRRIETLFTAWSEAEREQACDVIVRLNESLVDVLSKPD